MYIGSFHDREDNAVCHHHPLRFTGDGGKLFYINCAVIHDYAYAASITIQCGSLARR
jgi:hypothetical protein